LISFFGRLSNPAHSGFSVNLRPPPADSDEQKPPILEKFRRLAFEGMADELKYPANEKQA
jgi:hypothetical protein